MKECNQCGKCCTKYSDGGLSATESEIHMWELFNPEISEYVRNGKIWMSPDTGNQLTLCPWLRKVPNQEKYTCDIYFDRPDDCKYYPVTIDQMINDDCEMLDIRDLENPKKAQKTLDKLMADSRPACE
ncbi:zinc/iron-chelating domain-containing protein [Gammaproteobacteria bacterium 45_16_T64]|nr:zinc/iron-chelating domain-containing protein [Gammaproteobacteria bacterium 45_16_T64]